MKRVAALLLCVLLCASLAVSVGAQPQKLLYPGTVIAGDHVYLVGIPLEGGNIRVTANGQEIPANVVSVAGVQLGVTYYCVVSTTSSMSQLQQEQQRAGLNAINNALGANDSLVLVTMGRSVEFGEKLTDKESRSKAIEQACTPGTYGTNLYEGIDTVLKTITEQEKGPSCVIFFAEGIDNADIVKVTEEQAGRALQDAGLCVNFVALLTPPVTTYARGGADRLARFATLSNGGVCRVPLDAEDADKSSAAQQAVQELVSTVNGWAAIELSAADLPRDGKTVELNVTWTGNGVTMEDTASIAVADLPALPTPTEPETQPVPAQTLPTRPAVAEPSAAAPDATAPSIPAYQDDNSQQQLFYVIIGSATAMVLIMVAMVIVATRRTVTQKRIYAYENDLPVEIHDIPEDPKEEAVLEEKIGEVQKLPPRRRAAPPPIPLVMPKQEPKQAEKPQPKQEEKPQPKQKEKPKAEPALAPEKKSKRRSEPVQPVQPTDEAFIIPSCTVLLTPEGDPDNTVEVSIPVNGSRTFGRNQKAAVVLNAADNALSGLHFELQWDGRVLYLADRNSTNGTALNGSPQRPGHWARVESGAVIQAGSGRYRVAIVKT